MANRAYLLIVLPTMKEWKFAMFAFITGYAMRRSTSARIGPLQGLHDLLDFIPRRGWAQQGLDPSKDWTHEALLDADYIVHKVVRGILQRLRPQGLDLNNDWTPQRFHSVLICAPRT